MSAGCSASLRTVMQTAEAQNIVITDNLNTGVEQFTKRRVDL